MRHRRVSRDSTASCVRVAAGLSLVILWSLAPVQAEEFSTRRRIEEEKRESLAFTEASVPQTDGRLVFDYGGWLNARYSDYRDDDKDASSADPIDDTTMLDCRLWLKAILMPPLGASYENKHSFYVRVKDLYSVSRPKETAGGTDNDGPHLDYAYVLLDLQPLWIKAGREYVTLGQGLAYSDAHDGVELLYAFPKWDLKTFASRTLAHQDNVDTSVPGFEKGSDRYFYGAEYGYLGIAGHRLYGYALMQRDESNEEPQDPAHDYTYDSEYLAVGIRGWLKTKVSYWWELIRQTGKSVVYATDEKHDIEAWAQVVAVSYEPPVYARPLCYLKYAFGSGDKDRVSTTDTQNGNAAGKDNNFLPFGFLPTGYAFSGQLSNLHMVKIGCTFKPLEGYRTMKGFSLGIDYYRYFKDKASGGIYDPRATEDDDDVGGEIDITLLWPLFSDLHLSLQYGHFIPGKAYPPSTDDSEHYFSVSTSIIF